MSSRQLDEERIFHVARDLSNPVTRADYLDQVCAGDQALRERVEALLQAHEQSQGFLRSSQPEPAPTVESTSLAERPGTTIGRYRLMEQIGEGGMGIVFVAEQERPIRRKVAIKVIKPGMDSKAVVARFEAERQALAMMDHPNIAKVFDAGTTDSGHPYFAMELVKGVPITEYCDRNRLTIRERLELFIQVCQAIQHAHQKGIIHRDIKPSNVLVTLHDGKPVPKVIDFGVAKAINARLTDRTIYTEHLQVIGTLLYMSPEQAELSGLDIDTRSDIYSLGVLLYELLTGTTPFPKKELDEAAFDEQRRIIRENDPPRASVRISSLGETATAVAEHRKTDVRKLHQLVRGDLDWIVLKTLEKDRTRRYETANELAGDVQCFLNDEQVAASPPSRIYKVRKYARRHKSQVIAGFAVLLSLTGGVFGTTVQWFRAEEQRQIAEAQRQDSENQRHVLAKGVKALEAQKEIQEFIMEWALVEAMSGDRERADKALTIAKLVGASPTRMLLIRAQLEMFDGSLDESVKLLREAVEEDPKSTAAKAMLTMAYGYRGDHRAYAEVHFLLQDAVPETLEDHLFLAQVRLSTDPGEALRLANLALVLRDSPITKVVHAHVTGHLAIWEGDCDKIREARRECEDACRQMQPNAYALTIQLAMTHGAWHYASEGERSIDELRAVGAPIVEQLDRTAKGYPMGHLFKALYYDAVSETDKAREEYRNLARQSGFDWQQYYAACLYREGHYDEAYLSLFGVRDLDSRLHDPVTRAEAEKELASSWQRHVYPYDLSGNVAMLLWQGRIDKAREFCRDFDRDHADHFRPFDEEIIRYFGDESLSPEQLIATAKASTHHRSRLDLTTSYWLLGLEELARGQSEQAQSYFTACETEGVEYVTPLHWCKAFSARLSRDKHWSTFWADK